MRFDTAARKLTVAGGLLLLLLSGCGGEPSTPPVEKVVAALKAFPTYSVILEDMKTEGNFSKSFFHKYKVVQEENSWNTEWFRVSKDYFKNHENFLGMSLLTKKEGEVSSEVAPPGYAYVGDEQYGRWQKDSSGNSFWEFYGKYALFSSLFGGWYRPIYRGDYDSYRSYRKKRKPFFGSRNQYGTKGTVAKKAKPAFFARKKSASMSKSSAFKQKVSQRMGRSRTGFRGRAGGVGK